MQRSPNMEKILTVLMRITSIWQIKTIVFNEFLKSFIIESPSHERLKNLSDKLYTIGTGLEEGR